MTTRATTLAATVAALLVAGAGGAPSATRPPPTTLVTDSGLIHAFAQDSGTIAWIGGGFSVHVRRLAAKHGSVVGSALQEGGPQRIVGRPLALAGTTALWTSYNGGNTLETAIHTGSPTKRERLVYVLAHMPGPADGSFLSAVAGHGSTLVFGDVEQACDLEYNCQRLDVTGAVRRVDASGSAVAGLPSPFLLTTSSGWIALVPAKTPRFFPDIGPPRAAEYAPVQVYGPDGHLVSSFVPDGTPRAIALAWPKLALLFEFVDGSRRIELRDGRTGGYWNVGGEASFTRVPPTVGRVAVGTPGAVYAVGSAIYLLRAQQPQLVWRAAGAPIGLSIEGHRIAWAENVHGHGRIRTVNVKGTGR
jgi:hypothetical protein